MAISKKTEQIQQIATKAGVSVRTVERWWNGEGVSPGIDYGLRRAAEDLGIQPPSASFFEQPDGWYYVDTNYPEEGSCGPFATRLDAEAHAATAENSGDV